jgi:pimeloyl-ACP methyl ester carboxylesterase
MLATYHFPGPRGESLVRNVLDRRFGGRWSPVELDLISSYLYHISAAPALGEYSLNSLLEVVTSTDEAHKKSGRKADSREVVTANHSPESGTKTVIPAKTATFIYAREPLVDRLHELPKSLPVLVLFGDNDWLYNPMDIINRDIRNLRMGKRQDSSMTSPVFNSHSNELIKKDSVNDRGIDITLQVIPDAGHHIYLDNAKGFSNSITSWLKQRGF